MDSKLLIIEFREVYLPWASDPMKTTIRVNVNGKASTLMYQNSIEVQLASLSGDIQIHIVIQSENLALGSLSFSLGQLFKDNFTKEAEQLIKVEIPIEIVRIKLPKDVKQGIARVRLGAVIYDSKPREVENKKIVEEIVLQSKEVENAGEIEVKNQEKDEEAMFIKSASRGYIARKWFNEEKKKTEDSHILIQSAARGYVERKSITAEEPQGESSPKSPVLLQSVFRSYLSRKKTQPKTEENPAEEVQVTADQKQTEKTEEGESSLKSSDLLQSVSEPYLSHNENKPTEENKEVAESEGIADQNLEENEEKSPILIQSVCRGYLQRKKVPERAAPVVEDLCIKSAARGYLIRKNLNQSKKKPRPPLLNVDGKISGSENSYLGQIKQSEYYYKFASNILDKLRAELGPSFARILEEATSLGSKSPTKSPVRGSSRSGTRSPSKSPYKQTTKSSFSSFADEEETYIEIPSKRDIFLEKISGKNPQSLVLAIIGLIAKRNLFDIQAFETTAMKELLEAKDKAIELLDNSMKETHEQIAAEVEDLNEIEKALKEDIDKMQKAIIVHKNKSEELNNRKKLLKIEIEKLKESKIENISGIEKENIENLKIELNYYEKQRVDIENKLNQNVREFSHNLEELMNESNKLIVEKEEIGENLEKSKKELNAAKRDQERLLNEIKRLEGFIGIENEQNSVKILYDKLSSSHVQALEKLNSSINSLKLQKEEINSNCLMLHQKIESDIKKYSNSQLSYNKKIEDYNAIISTLNQNLHKLKIYIDQLEEIYNKKASIDHHFDTLLKNYEQNLEVKDALTEELSHFSDFMFALSQSFLKEHRIYKSLQLILEEKNYELKSMRLVVAEVKQSNPVYFPVKGDEIDEALAEYLNSRDQIIQLPFIRETSGNYYYGTRRALIKFERGKLSVKVGGGFLPIDEFIEAYTEVELEKFHMRNLGTSPRMKKFLGKWAGGILKDEQGSPEELRENLVRAAEKQAFISIYGVKSERISNSPSPKKSTEEFSI
ncbi:unnamed protein product [Blepharisma stoltei]|uniref:GAR domain-containing protein n=1 Tax=Blepharisma stoltei TaxID=1481888 RepID=A0AAU9KC28_9CILI|nr:unnamed protein product [Blepharisma stoltei]